MSEKIIDISQEVFSCTVFPGDPQPKRVVAQSLKNGDICNLTELSMCAHNGTHVDAPYHFLDYGRTIDEIPLDAFVGRCWVTHHEGDVLGEDAKTILEKAGGAWERILIGGKCAVTAEAAAVFADRRVRLVGNESQTVGPEDAPRQVHLILLGAGVALLEGIRLGGVPEGEYHLSAAPLNLGGSDGSPCRAYLISDI